MEKFKHIYFLVFVLALLGFEGCKSGKSTITDSKRVLALSLTEKLLKYIPPGYNIYYIVPKYFGKERIHSKEKQARKDFENRRIPGKIEDHLCYIPHTADIELNEFVKESKKCIEKFSKRKDNFFQYLVNINTELKIYAGSLLRSHFKIKTGIQKESALLFYDKGYMKDKIASGKVKTAQHLIIDGSDSLDPASFSSRIFSFFEEDWTKLVLKPAAEDSSKGIEFLDNDANKKSKLEQIYENQKEYLITKKQRIVVEKYIPGKVLRVDGYVQNGKIQNMITFDYYLAPIEFYQNANTQMHRQIWKSEDKKRYEKFSQKVIKALDYQTGIFHLEIIEQDNDEKTLHFLEIGARPGGLLPPVIKELGWDEYETYVLSQLGQQKEVKLSDKIAIKITAVFPKSIPSTFKKVWLDRIDYGDILQYTTYMNKEEVSFNLNKKELHTRGKNLLSATFIGEEGKDVERESLKFFNSITATVKPSKKSKKSFILKQGKWTTTDLEN